MAKVKNPLQERRDALLAEMSVPLQKIAKEIHERFAKDARGILLARYLVGERVKEVIEKEATIGANGVEQLAAYLGIQATTLYDCRSIVVAFSKEYIEEIALKEMPDGRHITFDHVRIIARLKTVADRKKFMGRVFVEGLSTVNLAAEIDSTGTQLTNRSRNGGRPPGRPSSSTAGAQQIEKSLNQIVNRAVVWQDAVVDDVLSMDASRIDDILLSKLKAAKTRVDDTKTVLDKLGIGLDKDITRVEKILAQVKENEDKTAAAVSTPAPKRKKSA